MSRHIYEARHRDTALDISRGPVEIVRDSAEHYPSTQVSLVPPPCDEFTTSDPSRRATRVSPPGTRSTVLPDSTYGRRSMWRGARPDSANVGHVDNASVGCAMYLSGWAMMRARKASRSALLAAGPTSIP